MKMLSELGEIRTGFQLRGAAKPEEGGANTIIQLGDVRDDGVDTGALIRMDLERARERDFVSAGDVVLRSRGASYRGAVVPDVPPGTVAAAPLFVLRLAGAGVLPEYVVWYMNQPRPQAILAAAAHGSHIPTVSREAFAGLEIVLPPLEEQQRIVEVDRLLREERELTLALLDQRERLAQEVLLRAVRKFADRKP